MKKIVIAGFLILLLAACGNENDENAADDTESGVEETDTTSDETEGAHEEAGNAEESNPEKNESTSGGEGEQQEETETAQDDESDQSTPDMKTAYRNKLVELEEQLAAEEKELGSTQRELTEFAGKSFNMWDDALNEVYAELEKQLSKDEMESLREEQRAWVQTRDAKAAEEAAKYEGGSMESMQYISSQAQLTKERAYELITDYMS
ncbi:lysozyme inhibitor LprI family protein [Oceanobacillus kapialis]|uniref:Lysozyme inhibitor LprI family protein n=1 Tax=Oceanobacillus kapialis TaxID=481353 RepID=A0ABW5PW93_9BACI